MSYSLLDFGKQARYSVLALNSFSCFVVDVVVERRLGFFIIYIG